MKRRIVPPRFSPNDEKNEIVKTLWKFLIKNGDTHLEDIMHFVINKFMIDENRILIANEHFIRMWVKRLLDEYKSVFYLLNQESVKHPDIYPPVYWTSNKIKFDSLITKSLLH